MALFIQEAFSPVNAVFSTLLVLLLLYWIMVILGVMDMDFIDMEWMPDLDVEGGEGFFPFFLGLLNIGEVPVMIVISILVVFAWFISLLSNFYFNPLDSLFLSIVFFFASIAGSFFLTSFTVRPLSRFFSPLHKDGEGRGKILYQEGVVVTSRVDETFGMVEIATSGSPITVNARTENGKVFLKGDRVLLYDHDKDKGIYFVDTYEKGQED